MKTCIANSFEDQYSFCRSCLVVDEQNLDDANNCLCVQCALKALESNCYKEYCPKSKNTQRERNLIDQLVQRFDSNTIAEYEFDSDVELSEVNYFVDPNSNVYRNLLPAEKENLVNGVVTELKQNKGNVQNAKVEGDSEAQGIWRKKKTPPFPPPTPPPKPVPKPVPAPPPSEPDDDFPIPKPVPVPGDDEDDDSGDDEPEPPKPKPKPKPPLIYTKTKVYTTYTPKKKTLTKWNPNVISKTVVIDECSGKRATITVTDTTTDTDYETIYKPIFKFTTTTDYDTVWWGTTMTKIKHDLKTKTETDYEIFTKTKYKNDIQTKTETEVEGTTKYIKVAKKTVTDTETEWDLKWKTKTITDSVPATKTTTDLTTKTTTQLSTITNHDRTRTKLKTKTMTRTKKIWNPRHTTTVSAKAFGGTIEGEEDGFQKEGFGVFKVPDDPAPLLASRRVIKLRNANGSNITATSIVGSNSSNPFNSQSNITSGGARSNTTAGAFVEVSAAPQTTTAMIVYTTLAVSVATSMMLAFSYHTTLDSADNTIEENTEHSSSSDENNNWSDADDIELTNDEIRSLADQVPKSGLPAHEMAHKLGEDNSISLMVD